MNSTLVIVGVAVLLVLSFFLFRLSGRKHRGIPPQTPRIPSIPTEEDGGSIKGTVTKPAGSGPATKGRDIGVTVGVHGTNPDGTKDEVDLLELLGTMSEGAVQMYHFDGMKRQIREWLDEGYTVDEVIRLLEAMAKNSSLRQTQQGSGGNSQPNTVRAPLMVMGPPHDPWNTDS